MFNKILPIKRKKGQVAIFIVLVFNVLFILFAMTLNVAMVVHDKINFQNSLDLAAYYGAKQQAEVLNAMAHINYQMRQNWKLLAWRYRILGTLAQNIGIPKPGIPYTPGNWCPQNKYKETPCNNNREYFVCVAHSQWRRGVSGMDQNACTAVGIPIPDIPDMAEHSLLPSLPFPVFPAATQSVKDLQKELQASCPLEGALNALTAQFFLTHFRLDQKDRKIMMWKIYEETLEKGRDLNGQDIFEGVKKVFYLNLTHANRENVKNLSNYGLNEHNDFEGKDFFEIFGVFHVHPILQYSFSKYGTGGAYCEYRQNNTHSSDQYGFDYNNVIGYLRYANGTTWHVFHELLTDPSQQPRLRRLFNLNKHYPYYGHVETKSGALEVATLGFYKRSSDNVLYYGLRGEFPYRQRHQIFSLNWGGTIQFKGSAFAKPFGGKFGPQPAEQDRLIYTSHPPPAPRQIPMSGNLALFTLQPNYSRWPGDTRGLLDYRLHYTPSVFSPNSNHFLSKFGTITGNPGANKRMYSIGAFVHRILIGDHDDPLANPPGDVSGSHPLNFMRMIELMAVYPDMFDVSRYSISGNYMTTYFPKICKLLTNYTDECDDLTIQRYEIVNAAGYGSLDDPPHLRGDFGWPYYNYPPEPGDGYIEKNIDETEVEISVAPYFLKLNPGNPGNPKINISNIYRILSYEPHNVGRNDIVIKDYIGPNIFYPYLAKKLPGDLTSSWVPTRNLKRYFDYEFPTQSFLNCDSSPPKNYSIPTSCTGQPGKGAGRSGYSVKLVSCDYIADSSRVPNPPPNMDRFCPHH